VFFIALAFFLNFEKIYGDDVRSVLQNRYSRTYDDTEKIKPSDEARIRGDSRSSTEEEDDALLGSFISGLLPDDKDLKRIEKKQDNNSRSTDRNNRKNAVADKGKSPQTAENTRLSQRKRKENNDESRAANYEQDDETSQLSDIFSNRNLDEEARDDNFYRNKNSDASDEEYPQLNIAIEDFFSGRSVKIDNQKMENKRLGDNQARKFSDDNQSRSYNREGSEKRTDEPMSDNFRRDNNTSGKYNVNTKNEEEFYSRSQSAGGYSDYDYERGNSSSRAKQRADGYSEFSDNDAKLNRSSRTSDQRAWSRDGAQDYNSGQRYDNSYYGEYDAGSVRDRYNDNSYYGEHDAGSVRDRYNANYYEEQDYGYVDQYPDYGSAAEVSSFHGATSSNLHENYDYDAYQDSYPANDGSTLGTSSYGAYDASSNLGSTSGGLSSTYGSTIDTSSLYGTNSNLYGSTLGASSYGASSNLYGSTLGTSSYGTGSNLYGSTSGGLSSTYSSGMDSSSLYGTGSNLYGTTGGLSSSTYSSGMDSSSLYGTGSNLYGTTGSALGTSSYNAGSNLYGNMSGGLSSTYDSTNSSSLYGANSSSSYGQTNPLSSYGSGDMNSSYNQGSTYGPTAGANNLYGNQQQALGIQQSFQNNGAIGNSNTGNFGGLNSNYEGASNSANYSNSAESQLNAATVTDGNINTELTQENVSSSTAEEKYEDGNATADSSSSADKQEEKKATPENNDTGGENIKKKKTMLEKLDKHSKDKVEKSSTEKKSNKSKSRNDSQEFQEMDESNSPSEAVFSDDASESVNETSTESSGDLEEYAPSMLDTNADWKDEDASLHNVPLGKLLPERDDRSASSGDDSTDKDHKLSSRDF
jgi:hypothetical protein